MLSRLQFQLLSVLSLAQARSSGSSWRPSPSGWRSSPHSSHCYQSCNNDTFGDVHRVREPTWRDVVLTTLQCPFLTRIPKYRDKAILLAEAMKKLLVAPESFTLGPTLAYLLGAFSVPELAKGLMRCVKVECISQAIARP